MDKNDAHRGGGGGRGLVTGRRGEGVIATTNPPHGIGIIDATRSRIRRRGERRLVGSRDDTMGDLVVKGDEEDNNNGGCRGTNDIP